MGDPFGTIVPPDPIGNAGTIQGGVLGSLVTLFVNLLIIGGGIYALVNLILAGYAFMSAGDEPKKIEGAWGKIYQTLIGLAVMAGSFVLASIFSRLLFGSANFILSPVIPTL